MPLFTKQPELQGFGDADMEDPELLAELAELADEAGVAQAAGAGAVAARTRPVRDTQGMTPSLPPQPVAVRARDQA